MILNRNSHKDTKALMIKYVITLPAAGMRESGYPDEKYG